MVFDLAVTGDEIVDDARGCCRPVELAARVSRDFAFLLLFCPPRDDAEAVLDLPLFLLDVGSQLLGLERLFDPLAAAAVATVGGVDVGLQSSSSDDRLWRLLRRSGVRLVSGDCVANADVSEPLLMVDVDTRLVSDKVRLRDDDH